MNSLELISIFGFIVISFLAYPHWKHRLQWINPLDRSRGVIWGKAKAKEVDHYHNPYVPSAESFDNLHNRLVTSQKLLGELFYHACEIDREGELPMDLIERVRKNFSPNKQQEHEITESYLTGKTIRVREVTFPKYEDPPKMRLYQETLD